jgi:heme exporter protein D
MKHSVIAIIVVLVFGVVSFFGIQERNKDAFTPAQILAEKAYSYIPFWVNGELSAADDTLLLLSADNHSIFVKYDGEASGQVSVLGRMPSCKPNVATCPFQAQAIVPQDSFSKYFYMGGYGFFVWVSYGIALIILVLNFINPLQREAEVKKSLARQARRQAEINANHS